MAKQWVKLKLSLSFSLLFSASAFAGSEPVSGLTQNDLSRPEAVKQWLVENTATADKQVAQDFFVMGNDYMQKKNWSAAAKAFGESALFFPAPKTLRARADVELRMLGMIRSRKKGPNTMLKSDLEYALKMYSTSLAADDMLHTLTPDERQTVEADIQCISIFLKKPTSKTSCKPVQDYGAIN